MSDTPRTDAVSKKLIDFWGEGVTNTAEVVPADFARLLERELKALQPEEGLRWEPIETAPKDETTVLLLVPTSWGKWNKTLPIAGRWEGREPSTSGFWITFNADEAIQRVEPTHWMPLPQSTPQEEKR